MDEMNERSFYMSYLSCKMIHDHEQNEVKNAHSVDVVQESRLPQ